MDQTQSTSGISRNNWTAHENQLQVINNQELSEQSLYYPPPNIPPIPPYPFLKLKEMKPINPDIESVKEIEFKNI